MSAVEDLLNQLIIESGGSEHAANAEPAVEPVAKPAVEHPAEPVVELAVEPVAEPAVEHPAEPVVELVVEPVAEPAVEPVVELVAEPAVEPAVEHPAEPTEQVESVEDKIAHLNEVIKKYESVQPLLDEAVNKLTTLSSDISITQMTYRAVYRDNVEMLKHIIESDEFLGRLQKEHQELSQQVAELKSALQVKCAAESELAALMPK